MTNLRAALRKLTQARWFPTVTKPLLAGLLTSALVYGLKEGFGVSVLPGQVNQVVSPLVGFLVAAIVTKPAKSAAVGGAHVTVVTHVLPGQPSPGKAIAASLLDTLAAEIDGDPSLVLSLATRVLEQAAHPPISVPVQEAAAEQRGFVA